MLLPLHCQHTLFIPCSGGNKRKLSIAIAIMSIPRIIFLDEPTAGVDMSSRESIHTVFKTILINQETSLLLSSQRCACVVSNCIFIFCSKGAGADSTVLIKILQMPSYLVIVTRSVAFRRALCRYTI